MFLFNNGMCNDCDLFDMIQKNASFNEYSACHIYIKF